MLYCLFIMTHPTRVVTSGDYHTAGQQSRGDAHNRMSYPHKTRCWQPIMQAVNQLSKVVGSALAQTLNGVENDMPILH